MRGGKIGLGSRQFVLQTTVFSVRGGDHVAKMIDAPLQLLDLGGRSCFGGMLYFGFEVFDVLLLGQHDFLCDLVLLSQGTVHAVGWLKEVYRFGVSSLVNFSCCGGGAAVFSFLRRSTELFCQIPNSVPKLPKVMIK